MHVRVVSFTGAKDIDGGVRFVHERVLPMLSEQQGFRGLTASADRDGGVFAVLTLWDTAEDRDATESTLFPIRQEAAGVIGGDVSVELYEQLVSEVGESPPGAGSALMVTPTSMDPARIDDNAAYFTSQVAPTITASPGFQGLRNMIDRSTGEGLVGSAWSDAAARDQAAHDAMARRDQAAERGVTLGQPSLREILFADMR